jgi:hypothetical protein
LNGTALASGLGRENLAAPHSAVRALGGVERVERVEREPFAVRLHVGRLIELQVFDLLFPEDVRLVSETLLLASAAIAGPAILIADCRAAAPFSQEVGDAWSRAMRRYNPKVERSALLLDRANETFNLQIDRVVRCAGSPQRRWFHEVAEARSWLSEIMSASEVARLDVVLGA